MYQRILVAVDGSPTSRAALEEAIKLAREPSATLHIVHVLDEVSVNWDSNYARPAERWKTLEAKGDEVLQASAASARKDGIACDTKLVQMDRLGLRVAEAIAEEAESWGADLIVLGTHGRRGVHHALLGSVAEAVVRVATKPVLLIRGR